MSVINTQAVVLKALKFKENDIILTLFTRNYGKVSAIARGAQKPKSRLMATSQVFSYNNYVLRKQNDMYVVYQSESIKSFYNIATDFDAFSYASFIMKLVEGVLVEGQTNNRLFVLLVRTLFLYSEGVDNPKFILDAFIVKFLDYTGFKPNVDACTSCSSTNYRKAVFSISDGGIVCDKCIKKQENYLKIDQTTIRLMQYILKNDIIDINKAEVAKVLVDELFFLLKKYLINYFEYINFKSIDMLKNLT
ncbi:DNA repair protein RecO [Peptostreptococcus anaerobius]|uniref:DNA repair protein RecO n=1 Tax=Peptostreptococcus anaerobius TaxID=1261 RepID=UPI00321BA83B